MEPHSTASRIPKSSPPGSSEAAVWGRLLEPANTDLSVDAARYIVNLRFPQPDTHRMRELAEKARAGTLTATESMEADIYERVGHALSLMKSKARRALKRAGGGA